MISFERQVDILPPSAIVHPVTFIGLGGIGSFAVYTARKMGFNQFTLWDHDAVLPHNIPSQHFDETDSGKPKVEGISRQLNACLDGACQVRVEWREFTREKELEGIVISGVDSMLSREEIWAGVKSSRAFVPLYIDGRVGIEWNDEQQKVTGEWIEIFTVRPSRIEDCELYELHLFSDEDSAPLRCTAQAVAYVGSFIAGFIGANLRKWVMKEPYHRYILYDCLTNQIMVATL